MTRVPNLLNLSIDEAISELKESINRKKQEQIKKTERVMASKTAPKKKETDDNKIEIEKIIASRKKDLDDKENKHEAAYIVYDKPRKYTPQRYNIEKY